MTKNEAKIVLAKKVWEQINWFTNNFSTEIGALGLVKVKEYDGEKCFYVEELLFPKQKVTGATVVIDKETGWNDLVRERGLKGLENVAFYWHRHPGSAHHSGTDEEHTFGAFMDPEHKRPYFIFYQTAVGTNGFNEEARIELRKPIRAVITDVEVTVDDPEENKIAEECMKIAEKCIVKETPVAQSFTNFNGNLRDYNDYDRFRDFDYSKRDYTPQIKKPEYESIVLNANVEQNHFDNDLFKNIPTAEEDKVSITYENGQATILAGTVFDNILANILKDPTHDLTKCVRQKASEPTKTGVMIKWNLQPSSGSYYKLRENLNKLYADFLRILNKQYEKEGVFSNLTETQSTIQQANKDNDTDDIEPCMIITDFNEIGVVINELVDSFDVRWIVPGVEAEIREHEEAEPIGHIVVDKGWREATITGELLLMYLSGELVENDIAEFKGLNESDLENKVAKGGKKNGSKK